MPKASVRECILSVVLIITSIFSYFNYALLAIIGVEGTFTSLAFKGFSALITIWVIYEYMCNRKQFKLKKSLGIVICLIPIAMTLTILKYGFLHDVLRSYFLGYFVCVIPAVLAGHLFYYKKNELPWQPAIIVCVLLADIAMLRVLCTPGAAPDYYVFGWNYQMLSYIGTLTAILSVFVLSNYKKSLNIAGGSKEKTVKIFLIVSIFIGIWATISGQGRGALILLVLFAVYMITSMSIKYNQNHKNVLNKILLVLTFVVVFIIIKTQIADENLADNVLLSGRMGQFIKGMLENPKEYILYSARGKIYVKVLPAIKNSPIWGHGIGSVFYAADTYSHNIFLDIMCELGIIGIGIFIALSCRLIKNSQKDLCTYFVWWILLSDFFVLQLSGYYLYHTGIWFSIGYLLSSTKINEKIRKSDETDKT